MTQLSRRDLVKTAGTATGALLLGQLLRSGAAAGSPLKHRPECVPPAPCTVRLSAEEGLQELLDGNRRFVRDKLKNPRQKVRRIVEVSCGQAPFAAILSCSDSRVPPEIIFDQGLGDLFVVRLAGNILDDAGVASLVFGVTHLGARVLIVLGHDSCGALAAAVDGHEDVGDEGPYFPIALGPAVTAANTNFGPFTLPGDRAAWINHSIDENVRLSVEAFTALTSDAQGCVPRFQDLVSGGELLVVGARYRLSTGQVDLL
jgi:carbonic anhydrase